MGQCTTVVFYISRQLVDSGLPTFEVEDFRKEKVITQLNLSVLA